MRVGAHTQLPAASQLPRPLHVAAGVQTATKHTARSTSSEPANARAEEMDPRTFASGVRVAIRGACVAWHEQEADHETRQVPSTAARGSNERTGCVGVERVAQAVARRRVAVACQRADQRHRQCTSQGQSKKLQYRCRCTCRKPGSTGTKARNLSTADNAKVSPDEAGRRGARAKAEASQRGSQNVQLGAHFEQAASPAQFAWHVHTLRGTRNTHEAWLIEIEKASHNQGCTA